MLPLSRFELRDVVLCEDIILISLCDGVILRLVADPYLADMPKPKLMLADDLAGDLCRVCCVAANNNALSEPCQNTIAIFYGTHLIAPQSKQRARFDEYTAIALFRCPSGIDVCELLVAYGRFKNLFGRFGRGHCQFVVAIKIFIRIVLIQRFDLFIGQQFGGSGIILTIHISTVEKVHISGAESELIAVHIELQYHTERGGAPDDDCVAVFAEIVPAVTCS